jgi:DNA-binding XRE family transcriptional regulator
LCKAPCYPADFLDRPADEVRGFFVGCGLFFLDFCGGLGIVEVEAADRYRRGQALRQMRVYKRHLTQEQLAYVLGISPILLSDIECGRADMPDTIDPRLLEAL